MPSIPSLLLPNGDTENWEAGAGRALAPVWTQRPLVQTYHGSLGILGSALLAGVSLRPPVPAPHSLWTSSALAPVGGALCLHMHNPQTSATPPSPSFVATKTNVHTGQVTRLLMGREAELGSKLRSLMALLLPDLRAHS